MNAISFSLFGNAKIYVVGAIENARLAPIFYPGWDAVFHVERGHRAIPRLIAAGATVIERTSEPALMGTLWRFETIGCLQYDRVICRDVDCRLGPREVTAVNDWIERGKILHTMWDRVRTRRRHLSAGMFGMKTGWWDVLGELATWKKTGINGNDEDFLEQRLWPTFHTNVTAHTRHPSLGEVPFPPGCPIAPRVGTTFKP